MAYKLYLSAYLLLQIAACSVPVESDGDVNLLEPLQPYVGKILGELDLISEDRKETLSSISELISEQLELGGNAKLTFICSRNSRRSHMSQVWSQTAACYYGIDSVFSFSGGIDASACNIRTVHALRRAGFSVVGSTESENPVYLIQFSDERPPVKAFSKLYGHDENPKEEFIALMCCSKADMQCPVVQGASSRFAIHYEDPAEGDDTSEEADVYDDRCREISREMFYIMSKVDQ